MKNMLIIGLGDFGHYLCRYLLRMKNEVMAIDKSEEALEDLQNLVSNRLIADCTSRTALTRVGVSNFDMCFVCVGSDFKSNLIIVTLLRELGAKYIVSQTDDEMLERLLLNNGADEVIHPNRDSARRASVKYSSEHIFDYQRLRDGYSIYEITPLRDWIGKSPRQCDIQNKYHVYIIGILSDNGKANYMPNPDITIQSSDKLLALMHETTMEQLLKKL
ncbi:MAG: TrkA family potassium uptake protein [Eubacteriales bacterium]|nr:TrkA family potassium uptake protein [Eubacteriales bacterium]